ncbi:MAG: ribonuclease HII [Candidatus Thorarchaeota archaeon]
MSPSDSKLRGIAGIDEAGRGPLIGPLVVCGALFEQETIHDLNDLRVKDSKMSTPRRRMQLLEPIKRLASKIELRSISASEIDRLRGQKVNLNEIEVRAFVSIAQALKPSLLYLDAADVKAQRFGMAVSQRSGLSKLGCKVVSEHKADSKYPVVSAASIVAKVERDKAIKLLHEEYGDFGSGYPSDPKTIKFVRDILSESGELPNIVRHSWESVNRIRAELETEQLRLG